LKNLILRSAPSRAAAPASPSCFEMTLRASSA
jgi:hypothetical protein